MSAPKQTTHERAEKMVAERLGWRIGTDMAGEISFIRVENGKVMFDAPDWLHKELWSEAVRLQEELLKREEA